MVYPITQIKMEFYYYALCHVCKKPSPDLKKCSSCKVLFYCSREHQQKDWQNHKTLCKVITKTSKILSLPSDPTPEDVNRFKHSSALLWQCELRRHLDAFEHQIWMFPKICAVCYSKEVNLICNACLSVGYCSTQHQDSHHDSHEAYCSILKLSLIIHQSLNNDKISKDYSQIRITREAQMLPEDAESVFKLMGFHTLHDSSKQYVDFLIMSEYYCPIFNMIYALEKSGFIQNREGRKNKLVIHIIVPVHNVVEYRMWWMLILEFFSHWVLNLKATKIFVVGPAIIGEQTLTFIFRCPECQAKRYRGTVIQLESYYHGLAHVSAKPDLVVFVSGFHVFPGTDTYTWKRSIPKWIRYKGVPTLLTSYNESELKNNIAMFPQQQIKFYVSPQRNPYSNLRPIRNWEEGGEPIYYQNQYIAIIAKK